MAVSLQAIRNQFAVIQMYFHLAIFVRVFVLQRSRPYVFLIRPFSEPGNTRHSAKSRNPVGKGTTACLLLSWILEQSWRLHANLSQYKFNLTHSILRRRAG
jgi:hypothetical protein